MLTLINRLSFLQKSILFSATTVALLSFMYAISGVIIPFFISFILSYLLNPIVDRFEFVFRKRIIAVVALYILMGIGMIIFFNYIIPLLLSEFNDLSTKLPFYGAKVKEWTFLVKHRIEKDIPLIEQLQVIDKMQIQLQEIAFTLAQKIPTFFLSTFSTLSYLLLIPIILFFFLQQGPDLKTTFFQLIPNKYFELLIYLFYSVGDKLGNYLRGLFVETIIIGLLSTAMMLALGVDYSVLLGTLAGVMNIIPYVGPLLGAIPAIIIFYLKVKTMNALLYIILGFAIVQAIDNVILKPIIYSHSVDLHPLSVLFFLLLGGMFAGVWGLILAVPVAGILKVTISVIMKEINFRIRFNQERLG